MGCITGAVLLKAARQAQSELDTVNYLLNRAENRADELRKQKAKLQSEVTELLAEATGEMR